ncbi:MAG: hypothetical protein ACHQ52_03630 [Candidatus Eisenbacteria bacterium]
MASEPALDPADRALLERLADRIVELHLEVPAVLALETARPLSLVAGQALTFFEPIVQSLFRLPDYQRFARIIEHREHLETFARLIEQRADAAHGSPPRGGAGV